MREQGHRLVMVLTRCKDMDVYAGAPHSYWILCRVQCLCAHKGEVDRDLDTRIIEYRNNNTTL